MSTVMSSGSLALLIRFYNKQWQFSFGMNVIASRYQLLVGSHRPSVQFASSDSYLNMHMLFNTAVALFRGHTKQGIYPDPEDDSSQMINTYRIPYPNLAY